MLSPVLDNKNDFQPQPITPLINKLCSSYPNNNSNQDRKEAYLCCIDKNQDTLNIFRMLSHPFFYCWITPHSIVDKHNFEFKFNMYISNNNNVYKYIFSSSFKQISSIHNIATSSRKHFPVQKFPQLLPETLLHRRISFASDLELMDKYMCLDDKLLSFDSNSNSKYICFGPGKQHWWSSTKREATNKDINTLSFILCKLFNSSSFTFMSDSFNQFIINGCQIINDIRIIIQSKAFILLHNLRRKTLLNTVRDDKNKSNQLYTDLNKKYTKYHTLTVVARPVHGVKNVSLIDHWALKFEGDTHLLTLDYYANSTIIANLEINDCIGQKIFWYSWCANSKQLMTQRWGTLSKIYLNENNTAGITGECIGRLVEAWQSKHPKYCSMSNNCQHFVRDILTVFANNAAKYLSTQFHHRVVEGIIFPSLPLVDEIDEQKRMKEIKKILLKTLNKYNINDNDDDNKDNDNNDDDLVIITQKPNNYVSIDDHDALTADDATITSTCITDDKDDNDDNNDIVHNVTDDNIDNLPLIRFEEWLCLSLGMNKYFDLFCKQQLNQIQFIQWFNTATLIDNVGITFKPHYMFIIDQAKEYNLDDINYKPKSVKIYQNEFKKWLKNECRLEKYEDLFIKYNINDIRQIKYFTEDILKEIGINLSPHIKFIMEQSGKYAANSNPIDDINKK